MKAPTFPDDSDGGCPTGKEELDVLIVLCPYALSSGHGEGDNLCPFPLHLPSPSEKLCVLGVAPWPSRLNVVDAELIQFSGDPQFVFQGKAYAFRLGAVSERRVIKEHASWQGQRHRPPTLLGFRWTQKTIITFSLEPLKVGQNFLVGEGEPNGRGVFGDGVGL